MLLVNMRLLSVITVYSCSIFDYWSWRNVYNGKLGFDYRHSKPRYIYIYTHT